MTARILFCTALVGSMIIAGTFAAPPKRAKEIAPAVDISRISAGQTAFALDLYHALRERETGNLFFSPISISTALAMTAAGARGETAEQMAAVLRLQHPVVQLEDGSLHPNEDLHAAIGALLNRLQQAKTDDADDAPAPRLDIANALWGQKGYPFLDSFIAFLDAKYGAPLTELDFMQAEEAARIINEWVEQKTEDRIADLLTPDVVRGAALVLTNAIYFKGDWKEAFDPDRTRDEKFFVDADTNVTVPMMQQREYFEYAESGDFKMLRLPYEGESLSMVVILPNKPRTLDEIEQQFSAERMEGWMDGLVRQDVLVTMPRFTMTQQFSLRKVLQSMGMTLAFDPGADFSGIDGSGALFISDVIHKAFVEVNEEGTEAAAATGVVMPTSAVGAQPRFFRADRPFVFLIHDAETDSVLFMGRVIDPS